MGLFASSLKTNADRMLHNIDKKVEAIAVELFTEVVFLSPANPSMSTSQRMAPKAKGEFNNNWFAGKNTEVVTHTSARSMTGRDSRASIRTLVNAKAFYKQNGFVTLTNTTHYGGKVEYSGWPSGKSPYAPVRSAFIAVAPKYK